MISSTVKHLFISLYKRILEVRLITAETRTKDKNCNKKSSNGLRWKDLLNINGRNESSHWIPSPLTGLGEAQMVKSWLTLWTCTFSNKLKREKHKISRTNNNNNRAFLFLILGRSLNLRHRMDGKVICAEAESDEKCNWWSRSPPHQNNRIAATK